MHKEVKILKKIAVAIAIAAVLTIIGISVLTGLYGGTAKAADATYVPGSKCKTCHIKQFKAHAETPHAKSLENVIDAGEETNAECLPCHTTGYGQPGGFVDVASTADLAGTTCQACHGPGSAHIEKGLSKEQRRAAIQKTPKDACIKCHKPHEAHPDIGAKALPSLKKKMEKLQARIKELGG
jgi:hypothetical protein